MDGLTIAYRECEPGYFFRGVSRPEATLLCCGKGKLCCAAQGQTLTLEQGAYLILAPDTWFMLFAPDTCAPTFLELTFPWSGEPFRPVSGTHSLAAQLLEEAAARQIHFEAMCGFLLQQLMILLARQGVFSPDAGPKGEQAILCRTQRIISAHAREKLSVPMVAQKAGVSPSYLTALFHKHLPFSPGAYIRQVKLWESRAMIREGALNFTQIAECLEYSTVHQFSRQFKEVFGITPTEYARQVRM